MISLKNVCKNYGAIKALDHINFEIQKGEVVGFLGPNGAGKSTTMRLITGYLQPSSGQVTVGAINVADNPVAAQKIIGYLPESVALYNDMVVFDFLSFMGQMRGLNAQTFKNRLKIVMTECQLESVMSRKIGELSKGFRQRVGLAQALLHDPEILILDEPTVGLDPNQISEIRNLIKSIGQTKTILLSTHILSEVSATCQRLLIINKGKIVAEGAPETLMKNTQGHSYQVAIRGELENVKNKLQSLPSIQRLHLHNSEQDLHQIQLDCEGSSDISEDIFDLAVQNSWRLAKLTKEQQSLENVFKDLTQ